MISTKILPNRRLARAIWGSALFLSLLLLLLPMVFKLNGVPHADWQQFLGRFHPLLIHLPIGFLLLVPLLEIGGRWKPALRESAGFVLVLACASSLGALALGYLLAYGSGDSGAGVSRHMWGGIGLCIGVMLCLLARPLWTTGTAPMLYPVLLTFVLLEMSWTAHQGGSLTHGSNYLTRYLPASLKSWSELGTSQAKGAAPDSFYAQHIDPVFDAKCVSCHGESKVDGGLRLDTYDRVMRGGKDGAVIRPGDPDKSLLMMRVTLPAGHKKFMPAEGKPPLNPEEIAWIRAWISQGASSTATSLAGIAIQVSNDPPLQPVGDYSTLMPEILQMNKAAGAKLVLVSSKPSDGLILRTVDVAKGFGDVQLAAFTKYAPYVVEIELGRTAVTDASFDTLSKFTHLRALHLEDTSVTGGGLVRLTPLTQLTYLNLSGTKVTKDSLTPLGAIKNLHHVYLYNTPAQPLTSAGPAPVKEGKNP